MNLQKPVVTSRRDDEQTTINLPPLSRAMRRKFLVSKKDKFSSRVLKLMSN